MQNRKSLVYTVIVSILFAAVVGIILIHRNKFIDFPVYYLAGKSLMHGRLDLYSPTFSGGALMDYRYPPFFLTAFGWLGLLPYMWAAYIWYWLCILQIAGCVFILRRASKRQGIDHDGGQNEKAVWLVALFAVGQYFVAILHYGNAHLLMTFLLFGSFYMALRHKDCAGGLLLSLAITIKIIPLIAIPYFVLKQRWKFLMYTGMFLLILNLMPALYFGFNKNAVLLQTWVEHVVLNQDAHEENSQINLSLKGQLRRYLTEIDYSQRVTGTEYTDTNYRSVNVLSLRPYQANQLWMIFALLLYASGLALIWVTSRHKHIYTIENGQHQRIMKNRSSGQSGSTYFDERALLELGLVICLMLIIGPNTPKNYFIKLLWPVVALANFAFNRTDSAARFCKWILIFIAAVNAALPLLPGRFIQRLLLVIGVDFYITVALLVGVMLALISSSRQRYFARQ